MDLSIELGERYDVDPSLSSLGSLVELREYLAEEISEMKRHGVDPTQADIVDKNPMNILAYYLAGRAPIPEELGHEWTEGDYPDIDCFHEKTMIKCADGDKKIEDIAVNDYVFDPDDNVQLVIHVQHRKKSLGEKIFKLGWNDGTSTTVTENQIICVDGKEIKAKDLLDYGKAHW